MLVQVTCLLVIVSIYLFIRKKAAGPVINVDELESALIDPFKSNNSEDVSIYEIDGEVLSNYGIRANSLVQFIIESLNDQGVDTDSISPSLNYVNFIDIARRVNLYDITASINDKIHDKRLGEGVFGKFHRSGLSVNGLVEVLNGKYPELVDNLLARLALALKVDVKTLDEHKGVIVVASIVAQFIATISDNQPARRFLDAALVIAVACAFNDDGLTHPISKAFNKVSESLTKAVELSKKFELVRANLDGSSYLENKAYVQATDYYTKIYNDIKNLNKFLNRNIFDRPSPELSRLDRPSSELSRPDRLPLQVQKAFENTFSPTLLKIDQQKFIYSFNSINSINCKLLAIDCYNLATNIEINNFCNKYRNESNEDCYNEFKNISKRIQNTFNKLNDGDYEKITIYYKNQYELYNNIEQEYSSKELFISEILTRIKIGTTNDQYILISPTSSADGGRRRRGVDYNHVGANGGGGYIAAAYGFKDDGANGGGGYNPAADDADGGDDYNPPGADGGRRRGGGDYWADGGRRGGSDYWADGADIEEEEE